MKSGWQTTEFWMTVVVILADVLGAVSQHVPAPYAGLASTIAGAAYALSRGLAKQSSAGTAVTGTGDVNVNAPAPTSPSALD